LQLTGSRLNPFAKPTCATDGYSADEVLMDNVVGSRDRHPHDEIDLVMHR
jgi:hypothetical protein